MPEKILYNKSTIKSRLRLTKPAFVQLVHQGLKMAAGFKAEVKGFDILIHSIEMIQHSFSVGEVTQDLLLKLSIEKAQGWMPFKADTELKINWTWRATHNDGYPAIKIQNLEVSNDKKTKLGLLNLNIGIPKIIERKIFGEMEERISQIEQAANRQIRKSCNQLFSKTYEVLLPNQTASDHPKVKLEKWLWDVSIDHNELIFDLNIIAQTAWMNMRFTPFQFHVNRKVLPIDTNSTLSLPLPFEEIYYRSQQIEVPVGKLGRSKISVMNLVVLDAKKSKMEFQLTGDVAAAVSLAIEIKDESIPRIEISKLDLKLENKLLDFGASLFERKIQSSLQDELDEQIKHQVGRLVDLVNSYLTAWQPSIFIQDRPLSLGDWKINAIFHSRSLVLILESDYFSHVTINALPEGLLDYSK